VHVDLDERLVADAGEAVHLAGLDHEDIARAGLELLPLDVSPVEGASSSPMMSNATADVRRVGGRGRNHDAEEMEWEPNGMQPRACERRSTGA
jgi:hypothetical protein